jgi:hypothetical protein
MARYVVPHLRSENPVITGAIENSSANRIIGVICLLEFLLSSYQSERWLGGAVGIKAALVDSSGSIRVKENSVQLIPVQLTGELH